MGIEPIPDFLNHFSLRLTSPEGLSDALAGEVARGAGRVLVAGGDGTVAAAAHVLAGSRAEAPGTVTVAAPQPKGARR